MTELVLRPYQEVAVKFLLERRRSVLGSDMGTGKTPIVFAAASAAMLARKRKGYVGVYSLIIASKSLTGMWERKINDWSPVAHVGRYGDDFDEFLEWPCGMHSHHWYILTYDQFRRLQQRGRIPTPTCIAVDEAHNCAAVSTLRGKSMFGPGSLLRDARHTWLVTGTPFPNNITDCYSLFNFCLLGKLGEFWAFADRYAYVMQTDYGQAAKGCKVHLLPELVELCRSVLHRDFIDDVLPELPGFEDIMVPIEAAGPAIQAPREILDFVLPSCLQRMDLESHLAHLTPDEDEWLSTFMRMFGLRKVESVVEFAANLLAQGEPVVICARHVEVIELIALGLFQAGYKGSVLYGPTPPKDRDEIVQEFQNGELQFVVVSIKVGGEGHDFTRSHIEVIAEIDWTPKALNQMKARIRRWGQQKISLYYNLFVEGSFDEKMYEIVTNKARAEDAFWQEFREPGSLAKRRAETGCPFIVDAQMEMEFGNGPTKSS